MIVYFLFSPKDDDYICTYIYSSEKNKIISYSYDEEYIVKTDEPKVKSCKDLEDKYSDKGKTKKGKPPILLQGNYNDIKEALFYLDGTLENFKQLIKARKKLPPVINPFDIDFDEEEIDEFEDMGPVRIDKKVDDPDFMDEFNSSDDENDDEYKDDFGDHDDDEYPDKYNDDDDDLY
jgi:hypothetical protein